MKHQVLHHQSIGQQQSFHHNMAQKVVCLPSTVKAVYRGIVCVIVLLIVIGAYYKLHHAGESGHPRYGSSQLVVHGGAALDDHRDAAHSKELHGQDLLNYMGDNLHVDLYARNVLSGFTFTAVLKNTGYATIPKGWSLFFNHLIIILRNDSQKEVLIADGQLQMTSIQGPLYKVQPTEQFKPIPPGGILKMAISGSGKYRNKFMTTFPNWYMWHSGLEPRVLKSTLSSDLNFVRGFDTEFEKKLNEFKFWSPQQRFYMNNMTDMGKSGKLVIPSPLHVDRPTKQDSLVKITSDFEVVCSEELSSEAHFLKEQLKLEKEIKETPSTKRYILLKLGQISLPSANHNPKNYHMSEAYSLDITHPTTITIQGQTAAGVFYGVQTLLSLAADPQHLRQVPLITIVDAPRFRVRSLMLDVSRHFSGVKTVESLLSILAMYKMNTLHLHLTDDQGWRLEIPGLPELTQIGGKRGHTIDEEDNLYPFFGTDPAGRDSGSGFYSTSDYRQILKTASKYHIRIVPEFDLPGHSHAAVRAMSRRKAVLVKKGQFEEARKFELTDPQDTALHYQVGGYKDTTINPCLNSTFVFLEHIIKSVIAAHKDVQPLKVIHLGGDEVPLDAFTSSPACDELLAKNPHLQSVKDIRPYFILRARELVQAHGLKLAVWEDGMMTDKGPPFDLKGAEGQVGVNTWDNRWEHGNPAGAAKFSEAGYKVVLSHATHLYLDHSQEPDPSDHGFNWAVTHSTTKGIFAYLPFNYYEVMNITSVRGKETGKATYCRPHGRIDCSPMKKPENVIGMQIHLWSEILFDFHDIQRQALPRLIAFAERAWHKAPWEDIESADKREVFLQQDYEMFANSIGYKELRRLEDMGMHYYLPAVGAVHEGKELKVNSAFPGLPIVWRKDDEKVWHDFNPQHKSNMAGKIILATRSFSNDRRGREIEVNTPG